MVFFGPLDFKNRLLARRKTFRRCSARIRAETRGLRPDPPDVRQKYFSADSAERPADTGGLRADTGGSARTPLRTGGRVHSKNVRRQKLILHLCSSRKNFRGGRPFAAEILVGLGLGLGLGFRLGLWLRLGLGLRLGLVLEYHNPYPNPNTDPTIISAAEVSPRGTGVLGRFLSADIFRVNSSASSRRSPRGSARIRAESAGVRRCPPNVRRTFGGVRRQIFLADVRRIRAEPGGVRAYPRGFVRIRGGSSSAEPVA